MTSTKKYCQCSRETNCILCPIDKKQFKLHLILRWCLVSFHVNRQWCVTLRISKFDRNFFGTSRTLKTLNASIVIIVKDNIYAFTYTSCSMNCFPNTLCKFLKILQFCSFYWNPSGKCHKINDDCCKTNGFGQYQYWWLFEFIFKLMN